MSYRFETPMGCFIRKIGAVKNGMVFEAVTKSFLNRLESTRCSDGICCVTGAENIDTSRCALGESPRQIERN